jgi:hypothetical protein
MVRILGHLIVTAFKVFWRIVFTSLFCAVLGAGAVLLITSAFTNDLHWPPTTMTIALAIVVAVLAAYAGGVTVLMIEAVRALKEAATVVEQEAVAPIKAVAQDLEGSKR